MKISCWILLCLLLAAACVVQTTHTYSSRWSCSCNGRSQYCLRDNWGLHCIDCQGNTTGRHCERCKDGFYRERAGLSCSPCHCHPTGSVRTTCDNRGRCNCKEGVTGEKCNRCFDGPIGPHGCSHRLQLREDSGSLSPPCFCYGHSSQCSAQSGFSFHKITSSFNEGPEGWTAAAQGVSPDEIHFRWSPKHQDLEVISTISLPIYLYAPAPYLGNQLLSYGQNLSFSLRLDRGVHHPSNNDVILEGAGLQVGASLGDMSSVVPCGQKINYSFRLDEQPSSRWRPQLSSLQFQTLLQNLTAIKVRATFSQEERGYFDNVQLVTAQRGYGVPARWVRTCICPPGYKGEFCEQCSANFRRRKPTEGAFSSCVPCSCRGGSCDPQTGDCYSADEDIGELSCPRDFYHDPWKPHACVKCPCPDGVSCSLGAGSLQPQCDRCPHGTTGLQCDICQEGFYGDPVGHTGVHLPCRPCECNGHINVSVPGSCDRSSGECLKCMNNTRGRRCETCLRGFFHSRASDACSSCDCDLRGSESIQCDDLGRCLCRPGFEGLRCQRSSCPACFNSIKTKMEMYSTKLRQLEALFSDTDGGLNPAIRPKMETVLRDVEELLNDLQDDARQLAGQEKWLQDRLSSVSRAQLSKLQDVEDVAEVANGAQQQHETYKMKVEEVQDLLKEMKRNLDQAKVELTLAEVPQGDAPQSSGFSSLVHTATNLADSHQMEADVMQQSATDALNDSTKSLALVRTLMNKENKVKELIGDLKTMYEQASTEVKGLENQANRLSSEAKDESNMAHSLLKDITAMEHDITSPLKEGVDAMVSRLGIQKEAANRSLGVFELLQGGVQEDMAATTNLLAKGRADQQKFNKLLNRVNIAKADTEDALRRISGNTDELNDSLNTLKGFNHQINSSRAQTDAAIQRLPIINATIQQAVSNNAETQSVLKDISADYDKALGSINMLENLVSSLEGTLRSLPFHATLPAERTQLKEDAEALRAKATAAVRDLNAELDTGRRLEVEVEQAATRATGALNNAKHARAAVGKTLRDIEGLLANTNQSGVVDEEQLKQLEDSLAGAQRNVEGLLPLFRDMEVLEAAQQHRLAGINKDVDHILADIKNLQDILNAIPLGCFNSPPIEEA